MFQTKPTPSPLPRLIARRMARDRSRQSWSRPVVTMATAGVGLGVALMILSLAIVTGFQSSIRELAIGFQSHITVLSSDLGQPWIERSREVEAELAALPGVTDVSPFYTMAGICETRSELAGVILKGTGPETHNELLAASMTRGAIPLGLAADSCVLSEALAAQLQVDTGDRVGVYLVSDRGDVRPRVLTLTGLYNTGMLEFDEQFVFIPQGHIQKSAGWGVELLVTMSGDTASARMIGEGGRPSFEWHLGDGKRWGGS